MTDTEKWDLDKIVLYFENKLSPQEEGEIDEFIQKDKDYASWIDDLYGGWLKDPDHFRQNLAPYEEEMATVLDKIISRNIKPSEDKPPIPVLKVNRNLRRIWLAAAAAAVGVIAVLTFGLWPHKCAVDDYQCLIASTGGVYRESITQMSDNQASPADLQNAVEVYRNKDYAEAIRVITPLLNKDLTPFQLHELTLMLGVSHLMEGHFEESLSYLETLKNKGSESAQLEAKWYMAIDYLSKKDYRSAKPLLREMKELQGPKAKTARRILNRIWWK